MSAPKKPWRYQRKTRPPGASPLVPYSKAHISFREQAERLVSRGMVGDVAEIERRLTTTNYYRLTGYFYFFRVHQGPSRNLGEQFRPNTTFDLVWEHYTFDAELRSLVFRALKKIEVAVRTQVSYHHGKKCGIFAYATDPAAINLGFRKTKDGTLVDRREDFLKEVHSRLKPNHEVFVDHFYDTYVDEYPPIYVVSELLTLGAMRHIYDGSPEDVQRLIANHFKLAPSVFSSWLLTLNNARNVCAHHGRFWNRSLGNKPAEPKNPIFRDPVAVFPQPTRLPDGTVVHRTDWPTAFTIMSMCNYMIDDIDRGCGWAKEVKALLDRYPRVKKIAMGFPDNWTASPVWYDVD